MIASKIMGQDSEWELLPWFPLHYHESLEHSQHMLRNHYDGRTSSGPCNSTLSIQNDTMYIPHEHLLIK
jgi:hypothetical protein